MYVCTEVETVQSKMNLVKHSGAVFILIIVLLCTVHTQTGTQTKLYPFWYWTRTQGHWAKKTQGHYYYQSWQYWPWTVCWRKWRMEGEGHDWPKQVECIQDREFSSAVSTKHHHAPSENGTQRSIFHAYIWPSVLNLPSDYDVIGIGSFKHFCVPCTVRSGSFS